MVEKKRSEAGYNLVILMVAMTLLNIALAIALPKWSHVIRREREEELISRGFQYAMAIHVFQNQHGRPPVRLEELVELEPRSIRKLWKDPMTEDGRWVLIPVGAGQPPPPGPGGPPPQPGDEDPDGRSPEPDDDEEIDPDSGIGEKKETVQIGPFHGVRSRSTKESILIFNGRTRYDEWHFTLQMIQAVMSGGGRADVPPGGGNIVGGDPTRIPDLSTRWLGRPLPSFLQPPQLPDGQMPDGRPNPNPRNPTIRR